jgi:hypothetical protein
MFSRDRHADEDASDDSGANSGASTPRKSSVVALPRRSAAASVFRAPPAAAPAAARKVPAASQARSSAVEPAHAAQEHGGRGSLGAEAKPKRPAANSMAPAGVGLRRMPCHAHTSSADNHDSTAEILPFSSM